MPSYPTERMTLGRTMSDEVYAIVYKAVDKRPVPEADIELEHLVYCDTNCGSGNPDVDVDITADVIKISVSEGTATTYGGLAGAIDGSNTTYNVAEGVYESGTAQVYLNQQEQVKGTNFTESTPTSGEVTITIAPTSGDIIIVSGHQNDFTPRLAYATSDTDNANLQITGLINGANKVYTLPGPYKTGTLKAFLDGGIQTQGSGEDWTETTSTTFTFITAPNSPDVVSATYERQDVGRRFENTNGTLTYTFNGTNKRGTCTGSYEPGSLELSRQGLILTPSGDYVETDPTAGTFDTVEAFATGVLSAAYTVGVNTKAVGERTRNTDVTAAATMTIYNRSVQADVTGGAFTVTLPTAADTTGMRFNVIKIDASANAVTIGGTVNGVVNPTLTTQYDSVTMESDGTEYFLR